MGAAKWFGGARGKELALASDVGGVVGFFPSRPGLGGGGERFSVFGGPRVLLGAQDCGGGNGNQLDIGDWHDCARRVSGSHTYRNTPILRY